MEALQRYKIFAKNYGLGTSHVDPASTLIDNAPRASSSSADLYMLNNITEFVPFVTYAGNIKLETTQKSIRWIYTDKEVDMPIRCLKIGFGGNKLHFSDTWNLFTVGSFSVLSKDEVTQIAFSAAKNYNLTLVGENDTLIIAEKPEWSNRTSIILNMIPGQIYNVDPEDQHLIGGNATRDPLALYPLWETIFYFSKSIGSVHGIAVGVWGDTTEIAYITPYGYLGAPGGDPDTTTSTEPPSDDLEGNLDTTTPTEPSPESTPADNPPKSESSNTPSKIYLIGGIASVIAIAIAVAAVALKKRRK